jgi:drug/metabolite transporter (DMT)-like permease
MRNFTYLILSLTVLCWAWAFPAIKVAVKELNPVDLTFLRFLIADVFLAAYIIKKRAFLRISEIPEVAALGITGITLYHISLNFGEIYISSGMASLIISTAPAFIFIASVIFLKEKPYPEKIVGTFLALFGVFVIIIGSKQITAFEIVGVVAVFAASLSATFYTVYGKSLFSKHDPLVLTSYAIILATLPLPLITSWKFSVSLETLLAVIFLAVFSTVVGYMGWYYVLNKMEASKAAVFLQVIPVISIVTGVMLLSERIDFSFTLGTALVLLGVYLVNRK